MKKNNNNKDIIIKTALISSTIMFVLLLYNNFVFVVEIFKKFLSLSTPFIYGFIIAYILNPLVKYFKDKHKIKKCYAIFLSYLIFICIIGTFTYMALPSIIENIKQLIVDMPMYIEKIQNYANEVISNPTMKDFLNSTGELATLEKYISYVSSTFMILLEKIFNIMLILGSNLIKLVIGFLVSIYMLVDKDKILLAIKNILSLLLEKSHKNIILEFFKNYHNMIRIYIGIKAIDSIIIGFLAFILLNIAGSEYTFLLTIVVTLSNMIPYFGPLIGEIVGFLLNLFVSPTKAISIFLLLLCLQIFDGYFLDPKLVGSKVGVRPIFLIFSVVIGGGFFGPIGMLLAAPTCAVVKIYYDKLILYKESDIKSK